MTKHTTAAALTAARTDLNLTQADIAAETGLSQSVVSRLLSTDSGKTAARIALYWFFRARRAEAKLERLAEAGVTVTD